ncbi:MraY family glycosyltransferase [Prochlorococcus sp. MIT 1307]|uniref:MraY family glycosyltransferase n=1 Tax=Prochlorococcus sp. MIT 1307 TaxID=3096219 RepID=UPI002A752159|nr:MraY family glycosyltransferase [Prochlorococcus sp. MIT 1307]
MINQYAITIFFGFITCSILSYSFVFLAQAIGIKFNLLDQPKMRKAHNTPLVRIGGIAITINLLITYPLILWINGYVQTKDYRVDTLIIIISCIFLSYLIGLIDDLCDGISPWPRLGGQIILAIINWLNGIRLDNIDLSFVNANIDTIILPDYLSFFATVIWIVGVINAFNWIDGLDGLAAGISFIATLGLTLINLSIGNIEIAFLASVLAGSCLGFLWHNFFPAKIFMGDGGAYVIGYTISILAIISLSVDESNVLFIPSLMIILLPLLDMTTVIFRRILQGNSPFHPDKSHFHHFLLNRDFSHRNTVLILYGISIIFLVLGIKLSNYV